MKKRITAATAGMLSAALLFSACSSSSGSKTSAGSTSDQSNLHITTIKATDPSKSPKAATDRKDTAVLSVANMDGVYNPLFYTQADDYYGIEMMFDTLIEPDKDGKPVSDAATWKVSSDGLTYTFTLKDGIKYWDGNPVKASDIAFAAEIVADPKYDGGGTWSGVGLQGVDDYTNGSANSISGIKVIDDKTVSFTLDHPNASAIWSFNTPLLEEAYYCPDFQKGDAPKVEAKTTPMGTGPYKYVAFKPGTELDLVANDNYFRDKAKIKNVVLSVTSEGQEFQRAKAGEVDLANATADPDNVDAAKKAGFINTILYPFWGWGYVQFDTNSPKFSDPKVRQALAYALNRKAVADKVYGPYASVNSVPTSTTSWSYTTDGMNSYSYSLDKARKLLDEAGWKLNANGKREKDGKVFTIDFSCTSGNAVTDVMAPLMKEDYAKLGIDVTIENIDWTTLSQKISKGALDATFLAYGYTSPDPDVSSSFKTGVSGNYYKYSDKTLDNYFDQELKATSNDARKPIFKKLYQQFNKTLPVMPIYQRDDCWVYNSRLQGIDTDTFVDPFLNFYKVSIK